MGRPGLLLTLTGGAGAGKTTLAAALAADRAGITVLHQDDFYFHDDPARGVWLPDAGGIPRLDVGDPRSLDLAALDRDATTALGASTVVIVEGMFAHRTTPASPHTRFDVYVDVPADLRLARKIERQCVRGTVPLDRLLSNYVRHRRTAHARHTEPARDTAHLVLDGELPVATLAARTWQAIG
ncbi:hypothetical protein O7635_31375 [Asanoa sp. WMMD1127]|uniref:hypothetical protein n=1 Tax=Asanoa sp. WMMD1127 TaxID=3016107 RepID=UPI0024172A76|nr:hypothetical protein [Asanoa sp. WMMD1127]MDG4826375.1 hypothetical protein [Asanoa sp. WMMD1127]